MYTRGTGGVLSGILSGYSRGYSRRARLSASRSSRVLKRKLRGTHRVLGRARVRYRHGTDVVPTRFNAAPTRYCGVLMGISRGTVGVLGVPRGTEGVLGGTKGILGPRRGSEVRVH
jgi:hypothetical protein